MSGGRHVKNPSPQYGYIRKNSNRKFTGRASVSEAGHYKQVLVEHLSGKLGTGDKCSVGVAIVATRGFFTFVTLNQSYNGSEK